MAKKHKTYKTLKALIAAYKAGEIKNANGTVPDLMIDNDITDVCVDTVYDEYGDVEDSVNVFVMHPADLLEDALKLLGIPYEDV